MYLTYIWLIFYMFGFSFGKETYNGYKLVEVHLSDERDIMQLQLLQGQDTKVSFWKFPSRLGETADIAVPPEHADTFLQTLNGLNLHYTVKQQDLGSLIEDEELQLTISKKSAVEDEFDLYTYHSHDEINGFLKSLVDKCNDNAALHCRKIKIGNSYEGRKMLVIKIGKRTEQQQPAIWIDAGIHAREWIAPATALYIMNKLVNTYDSSDRTRAVVDAFDWYILPSANPDGYEYSRNEDRFWRKTRSPNAGTHCVGTDPNRNWDFHWMETGASADPCSDVYGGSEAFSEVETQSMSQFLISGEAKFEVYMSLHAYGQYWLTPWGYTETTPDDYPLLLELGQAAAEAIRGVHGRQYTVGSSTLVLYSAAGGSDDWAKGMADIKHSFTVELRDDGRYGFLLPERQIKPNCKELYKGMLAMLNRLMPAA